MQNRCRSLWNPDYPGDLPGLVNGAGMGQLYLYVATFDSYWLTDFFQRV